MKLLRLESIKAFLLVIILLSINLMMAVNVSAATLSVKVEEESHHVVDWTRLPAQTAEMVQSINSVPGAAWQAVEYPQFKDKTVADLMQLLGSEDVNEEVSSSQSRFSMDLLMDREDFSLNRTENPNSRNPQLLRTRDLPSSFDARQAWPNCIRRIKSQKNCGSCWAFSASSSLADRFCIASGGNINVDLSPQFMLSCSGQNNGCRGGFLVATWRFLAAVGTVSEQCVPYVSATGSVPSCNTKSCGVQGQSSPFYKVKSARKLEGMTDIMNDLRANGPAQVAMAVYKDFYSYKSGVYHHVSGRFVGGHAVKVVGWGVDSASKLPYWICANSWGEDWGIDGYFWILRGRGECGFGRTVWSGKPSL